MVFARPMKVKNYHLALLHKRMRRKQINYVKYPELISINHRLPLKSATS